MASPIQHPQLPLPGYFSKFASFYIHQTGHSTLNILSDVISNDVQWSSHPIGPDSVIHDTAAGPAVGAAALVTSLSKDQLPKELLVSDIVPMMVSAARESLTSSPLPHVECKELDSQALTSVPDNYFTHSINNFSIFTFTNPGNAIQETYRTLRPNGLAIITCWRRFAPMYIVHAAQQKIRPDLPLMPTPSPEFYEQGVLQKVVEEHGFAKDKVTVVEKTLLVTEEENIAGLTTLMSGDMMAKAREGYTEEQKSQWGESVQQSIKEEIEKFGGIRFDAYVLFAIK
ncbi:hypothetical protein ANO14919_107760 [Xylariales sp. No.14919]|nr:hypothetical protein ANO14919_107760 [Xylariales sp. No.14919]